jgi:hypothetical protein
MNTQSQPSINGHEGRDSRGRFARGNPGGPGRPRRTPAPSHDDGRELATLVLELDWAIRESKRALRAYRRDEIDAFDLAWYRRRALQALRRYRWQVEVRQPQPGKAGDLGE